MGITFKNVLVTGGAGFIGSHLVDALVAEGCRVTVLDNLSTGAETNLTASGKARLIRGDIRDAQALAKAVEGAEAVFHLAAIVSVVQTTQDPLGTASINEMGSLHVLEAARAAGARRFVFASSCAVYGDDPILPKREDMLPKPLTPYAAQKLAIEHHVGVYGTLHGMETASLRFFNVYGPRQDPGSPYSGVISIFMLKALRNDPPVIFGDGLQTRDFVFVTDVVEALMLVAASPTASGQVFNVGTGRATAIADLWTNIAALSNTSVQAKSEPRRSGEVLHSRSSIDRARALLGFVPRIDLGVGLNETLKWYRNSYLAGHN